MIIETHAGHGYSGVEDGTIVCLFLQGIKSIKFMAAVNVIQASSEKYGKNFYTMVSYLVQMVTKKKDSVQSAPIVKTRSQSAKPKVSPFTGKIKCKKYPKAVQKSMSREQQMSFYNYCDQHK